MEGFIRLQSRDRAGKRREWSAWRLKGYRILDPDGRTVWHEHEAIRRRVLETYKECDADLFLFGSRASGKIGPHSDYDIGYFTEAPPSATQIAALREELEELPIPARAELVDFRFVPREFKEIALKHVEIWKRKKRNSLFTSKP